MNNNVQVIGINTWTGSSTEVQNFALLTGATYPIVVNGSNLAGEWGFSHNSIAIIDWANTIQFITSQSGHYSGYFGRDSSAIKTIMANLVLQQPLAIEQGHGSLPANFSLESSAPNPFSRQTRISYNIGNASTSSHYSLTIFDILGREVRRIVDGPLSSGNYHALWDGRNSRNVPSPSGIYFVVLADGISPSNVLRIAYFRD